MHVLRLRLLAAGILAVIAFLLYSSTLLPGQDLGDTASFQAIAGERLLTPRQGYPLYFAVIGLFVHALPVEAARATNLASAVAAAVAVGLVVLVGAELGGTLVAGLVAGLLLAGSYTFWSQAIIAEVYALHLLIVGACLLALISWYRRPSMWRLGLFFAVYALGFGNHLSMVLLFPGFALFLLIAAPGGPREMVRPRVVLLALGLASLFTLQYAWNFSSLLDEPGHRGYGELLRNFWFDVTKSDWRANMVYGIPESTLSDRFAMYWFDLRQQFGVPGALAALVGAVWLLWRRWRVGVMLLALWLANWLFAFTYNVGDTHVFYLSSHLVVALAAGCGAGWVVLAMRDTAASRRLVAWQKVLSAGTVWLVIAVVVAYPAWRAFDTYPAMDRSGDREPTRFLDQLTAGMDGGREILGTDMNWQLHNGLDYYAKDTRPDLVVFNLPDTLLYFPFLVATNAALGRQIVLTEGAATMVRDLYGHLFSLDRDPRLPVESLSERVATLPPGTRYVLAVIEAYPESPIDPTALSAATRQLGLRPDDLPTGRYAAVVGRVGERPVARLSGATPFRARTDLAGQLVDVRIECWLPADTIRRAGFGHVIVKGRHVLTLDRGVSFVALGPDGAATLRAWDPGLYAPQPRFIVRPGHGQ